MTTMASSETPWFVTAVSPCRLADQSRSYYVSNTNGSSPGKMIDFRPSPASLTNVGYVQDFGFRKLRLPHPRHQPSRGSHRVQAVTLYTSSFRSFIGSASVLIPIGHFHKVSSGTLDFSTRSLLKGAETELSSVSQSSCWAHRYAPAPSIPANLSRT